MIDITLVVVMVALAVAQRPSMVVSRGERRRWAQHVSQSRLVVVFSPEGRFLALALQGRLWNVCVVAQR